ncbi:bifunctional phosphopantothenoylcysteine decarboxylase/phosphopantothenate--cysteine ligase CoaBC [uncultured Granulicatella sp.]|uniref:bifunctional phosphopantothenoylcysteine decarboxylase/phosphopantothenate--cysteine ligase CoaBC n=1 Tax=uncultured Granulicatella sp. TaxID=316089 RepID=UPI0028D1DA89|nr:bifunctional phosphopantothenoylcysteine decarboxylase/phosphopantothenate--cysteine ligase CoaBC [uncultured Granulicatella sp.]
MLNQKKVAVYVTGGIAAYKALLFVRLLIKEGAQVKVAMTQSACQFVSPLTFQVLTKEKVMVDTFDENDPSVVQHIHFADWTELAIVIPATANTIAKMANGIADNFVTSALLATTAPKVLVPAMNEHMWENPATLRNCVQLQKDGVIMIEPSEGFLAEGYSGKGRLPEPEEVLQQIKELNLFDQEEQPLLGKKVLITAGGTKERIDPVRYISNDSSGKMGYALADDAIKKGAEVVLISATTTLPVPNGVKIEYVESAREMQEKVLNHFSSVDIAIMVAAVSDYRVKEPATQKMKKTDDEDEITLTLVKNPDILKQLGSLKKEGQTVIGFAAETHQVIEFAKQKLVKKNADFIIANDVSDQSIGFGADMHQVTILSKTGEEILLPKVSKQLLAKEIWNHLVPNL